MNRPAADPDGTPPAKGPPQPLVGMRVLEVAQALAGPFCARILQDLGAEVIKVEPPGGDAARGWGPPFVDGVGTMFAWANVGKRSVVLDLKTPQGMEALEALIRSVDILLDALRPGALAGLGLDDQRILELNPQVVHATVLPYGESGPLRDLPGYEPLMQAHGGLMSYTGTPDGPPVRAGTSVVDLGTGMWTAMGILAELLARPGGAGRGREPGIGGGPGGRIMSGEPGTRISGSLFDTALAWSGYHLLGAAGAGTVAGRWGSELPMIVPYGTFPTRTGPVMIAAGTDGLFLKLCAALEMHDLSGDERYRKNAARVEHRDELNRRIASATAVRTESEVLELLRAAGVPCAPVRNVGELLEDPQFRASEMLQTTASGFRQPLPLRFGGDRLQAADQPPGLGAHTRSELSGLDLSEETRQALGLGPSGQGPGRVPR